jgi:pyruvate carboxylase subunit B
VEVKDERGLLLERFGLAEAVEDRAREVRAPMPGLVVSVLVAPGRQVRAGEGLVVLEAMKMENELRAAADGTVKAVHVAPGDAVGKNALLVEFEAAPA